MFSIPSTKLPMVVRSTSVMICGMWPWKDGTRRSSTRNSLLLLIRVSSPSGSFGNGMHGIIGDLKLWQYVYFWHITILLYNLKGIGRDYLISFFATSWIAAYVILSMLCS